MIEILRKGFRLPIPTSQIVTFKKSQNLNGIQDRYSYSNTISLDKTAELLKLLDLSPLPTSKGAALQNGYTVDIVLNGSIQLRNQTLKITKESKDTVDLYLLYSDSSIVSELKETYINEVVKDLTYNKTISDFESRRDNLISPSVFLESQPKSGLYVIEEMPLAINLQWLIKKIFQDNNYTVYGDFISTTSTIKDYFIAANYGVYEIYTGTSFTPTFNTILTAYELLNVVLKLMNCYADVDDTNRTVVINSWTNLGNYKTNYVDYSKYFVDYTDFAFQSKLAKKNELTYMDSGTTFNSFFTNNLSDQDKATYLASEFGSGTLNLFDDEKVNDNGTIPTRPSGEVGETSAIRIFKLSENNVIQTIYQNGFAYIAYARKAVPVSMRIIYNEFHKDYTEFILTPLIQNLTFRYDDILAANFYMTKIFFIEQQSSYWIPLEINFSTEKKNITVKAMLIKQRKVISPILNNFNSVLLDFKTKVIFPKSYLLSMYPMPPNEYEWNDVIFKSYDQDKNTLIVNGVIIPAASLPQVFSLSDLTENSIVFEANKLTDTTPDTNTDSLYIQAVDTNGGVSNDAYVTLKHTGVASLESNFKQTALYAYHREDFDGMSFVVSVVDYVVGEKPNLNNTVNSATTVVIPGTAPNDTFNLIQTIDDYTNVKVNTSAFELYLRTKNAGIGKARAAVRLQVYDGVSTRTLREWSSANNQTQSISVPSDDFMISDLPSGRKIRVFFLCVFDNVRGSNSGSMDVWVEINKFDVAISTTKSI